MHARFTPACFSKSLPSPGVIGTLEATQPICIGHIRRQLTTPDEPQSTYIHKTDIEQLLRYLRPPDYGNDLVKYVGVNLEMI
jgi:hypothetical protein